MPLILFNKWKFRRLGAIFTLIFVIFPSSYYRGSQNDVMNFSLHSWCQMIDKWFKIIILMTETPENVMNLLNPSKKPPLHICYMMIMVRDIMKNQQNFLWQASFGFFFPYESSHPILTSLKNEKIKHFFQIVKHIWPKTKWS